MSTKYPEKCPKCKTETLPNDRAVLFTEQWGTFMVRQWNYYCKECDWTWANELQRKHNAEYYQKNYRRAKQGSDLWHPEY